MNFIFTYFLRLIQLQMRTELNSGEDHVLCFSGIRWIRAAVPDVMCSPTSSALLWPRTVPAELFMGQMVHSICGRKGWKPLCAWTITEKFTSEVDSSMCKLRCWTVSESHHIHKLAKLCDLRSISKYSRLPRKCGQGNIFTLFFVSLAQSKQECCHPSGVITKK